MTFLKKKKKKRHGSASGAATPRVGPTAWRTGLLVPLDQPAACEFAVSCSDLCTLHEVLRDDLPACICCLLGSPGWSSSVHAAAAATL